MKKPHPSKTPRPSSEDPGPRQEPPRQLSNAGAAAFFVAIVLGFLLLRWLAS